MGKIVNKRNAMLGWVTWTLGKRAAKRKAKAAAPALEGGRPNKSAIATGIAAVAGVLFFWRKAKKHTGGGGGAT